jgi:hypothetical protein
MWYTYVLWSDQDKQLASFLPEGSPNTLERR